MREECKDFENVLMACVRPVKMPLTSLTSKAFKAPPPPPTQTIAADAGLLLNDCFYYCSYSF